MRLLCAFIVGFNLFHLNYSEDVELTRNDTSSNLIPNNAALSIDPQSNSSVDFDPAEYVKVCFYTKINSTEPDFEMSVNDVDSFVNSSSYDSSKFLAIVIHGFQGSTNQSTLQLVKEAYLQKSGWCVLMIDWELMSKVNEYEKAVNNAKLVALLFGQWLSELISGGFIQPSNVQITGFSIGAHIAGMVGKNVAGKIAKIFALDPALPIYEHKNLSERLHMDDAEFVQVIHTCGSFISFESSLGHVDFYPNGGKFPQPSCVQPRTGGWAIQMVKMVVCSHTVVLRYFAESIFNETKFMAVRCGSWPEFQTGTCSLNQIPMGYATPTSARGNYYLNAY